MRKILLLLVLIISALGAAAQDVIVKTDGSTVLCRVVEVTASEVVYKRWNNLDGANYVMEKKNVSNINYEDGRQDQVNDPTNNAYAPGLQNTGDRQLNDNALMAIDRQLNSTAFAKRAKNLKIIGWSVGGTLVAAGVLMTIVFDYCKEYPESTTVPIMAVGVATTATCLIISNRYQKKANSLYATSLIEKEFDLGHDIAISTGIDVMRDAQFNQSALGIGFRLNF
ncbi:MAG: hypothetical protein J1E63_03010 [Muribaculaceae bacterium]|nr:hypothetical protein [Muribaculaceae bacterium]